MNPSNFHTFSYSKQVDYSVLSGGGFTIPTYLVPLLWEAMGMTLKHGERMKARIRIGEKVFEVQLINQAFDRNKYKNHPDVIQIRYSPSGELSQYLRTIFHESYFYIISEKEKRVGKTQVKVPEELAEEIIFSITSIDNEFRLDCIPLKARSVAMTQLSGYEELQFENMVDSIIENIPDQSASISERSGIVRYRKINHDINTTLKNLYDYRCQITGERTGEKYNTNVVEAHHIEYFTRSLNNDSSNIIIINPSFHRIIHQCNPVFNINELQFEFPNGVIEKLKLNKHLRS